MINRLTYSNLAIEITRRCNLKCAHCFRGDAQDLNMSPEVIDAFFDHTQAIYRLVFTGGEPFLNLEGMRYFLESAKRHNVLIASVNITTNGTVQTQELIDLIEDYSDYIKKFILPDINIKNCISIAISSDIFHHTDVETAFEWYKNNLSHVAKISQTKGGNVAIQRGRANDLPYAVPAPVEEIKQYKIQYKTKDNDTLCPTKNTFQLFSDKQIIVLCSLYITAKGDIINYSEYDYEYEDSNNSCKIGTVFVDSAKEMLEQFERWNVGKPFCVAEKDKSTKNVWHEFSENIKMLQKIKNTAPNQEYRDNLFLNQFIVRNKTMPEIYANYLYGFFVGADVFKYNDMFNSMSLDEQTRFIAERGNLYLNKDVYPQWILDKAKENEPSAEELEQLRMAATAIQNKEMLANLSDKDKQYYNLLLQSYGSSKKLLEMNPDSAQYESMVANDKERLDQFEAKHNIKS